MRLEGTSEPMTDRVTGSCLCKGVTFEIPGELRSIIACHCSQCAKTSGNFAAMARCDTRISGHIFVDSKSDYYDITDGLPQKKEW